jgi:hypothetical protein
VVGKSWRAVVRLVGYAASLWDVDLLELRLDRFLNHIYYWVTSRLDKEKREQFDFELDMPLDGEGPKAIVAATPAQIAEENDAITAIMAMKPQIERR